MSGSASDVKSRNSYTFHIQSGGSLYFVCNIVNKASHCVCNSGRDASHCVSNSGKDASPCVSNSGKDASPCVSNSGKDASPCVSNSGKDASPCVSNSGKDASPCVSNSGKDASHCNSNRGKKVSSLREFVKITSRNQRARYKAAFNAEYDEYQALHDKILCIVKRFSALEDELSGCKLGSVEYFRIKGTMYREHLTNQNDPSYHHAKKRLAFLYRKLSRIKRLVMDYDRACGTRKS